MLKRSACLGCKVAFQRFFWDSSNSFSLKATWEHVDEMSQPNKSAGVLSRYADSLATDAKRRFIQKISLLDGYDPLLEVPARATAVVPPVDASDLVLYVVL